MNTPDTYGIVFTQGRSQDLREGDAGWMNCQNYQCAERIGGAKRAPMGGLGALPQKIFVVTCSEINSNAIWLKKWGYCCFEALGYWWLSHIFIWRCPVRHCFELWQLNQLLTRFCLWISRTGWQTTLWTLNWKILKEWHDDDDGDSCWTVCNSVGDLGLALRMCTGCTEYLEVELASWRWSFEVIVQLELFSIN